MVIAMVRIKLTAFEQISIFFPGNIPVNSTYQILKCLKEKYTANYEI